MPSDSIQTFVHGTIPHFGARGARGDSAGHGRQLRCRRSVCGAPYPGTCAGGRGQVAGWGMGGRTTLGRCAHGNVHECRERAGAGQVGELLRAPAHHVTLLGGRAREQECGRWRHGACVCAVKGRGRGILSTRQSRQGAKGKFGGVP